MDSAEIGSLFFIALVSSCPGAFLGMGVSKALNPLMSYKISILAFSVILTFADFVLSGPGSKGIAYLIAVFWGLALGWFLPTGDLVFTMSIPKDQESEIVGFSYS